MCEKWNVIECTHEFQAITLIIQTHLMCLCALFMCPFFPYQTSTDTHTT